MVAQRVTAEFKKITQLPSVLERFAISALVRRSLELRPVPDRRPPPHLDPKIHRDLVRIERRAILRAAAAGALSATLASLAELSGRTWVLVLVTIAATGLEIAFLYWDALRAVHLLAERAGLHLAPNNDEDGPSTVTLSLARAAMELPDPAKGPLDINALRGASKFRLVLEAVLYKAKIGLTNFLVRLLIRRLVGRATVRYLLVFMAVPITALWNGIVCWLILRQARFRVIGPSAVEETLNRLVSETQSRPRPFAEALVRAAAATAVSKRRLHPNLVLLLEGLHERTGRIPVPEADDPARLLAALRALGPDERKRVLRILALALVLDGGVTKDEQRFWIRCLEVSGCAFPGDYVENLRHAFVRGEPLPF
jgi:hypothetical protein